MHVLGISCHYHDAASAFFASPFEDAAVLTVDGVGEWTTATCGRGTGDWGQGGTNRLELSQELRFPHSLGLLYSAFTAFLGFEVNEGEYKVMGMAPFGSPRYVDKVWKLIRVQPDGSFELDMDYFAFHHSTHQTFSRKFEALFGPPRDPRATAAAPLAPLSTAIPPSSASRGPSSWSTRPGARSTARSPSSGSSSAIRSLMNTSTTRPSSSSVWSTASSEARWWAGARDGSSGARAPSASAASSPTRGGPT